MLNWNYGILQNGSGALESPTSSSSTGRYYRVSRATSLTQVTILKEMPLVLCSRRQSIRFRKLRDCRVYQIESSGNHLSITIR